MSPWPGYSTLGGAGVGLTWAGTWLATVLGLAVWWGQPSREALEGGAWTCCWPPRWSSPRRDAHSLSPPAGTVESGRRGGDRCLGWFADPLLMVLLLPLFLVYYLSVGAPARGLWHVGLLGGLILVWR